MNLFESVVESVIFAGAKNREEAIEWLVAAEDASDDRLYGLWKLEQDFELPEGYLRGY